MATTTVVVCDICGEDAVGKRTIDVCRDHSANKPRRGRKPTTATEICPVCGKTFKKGAGLALHQRRAHSKQAAAK